MVDRTVTYRLVAEIGQLRSQMAQAGASVRKAADDMTAATKSGATFRAHLDKVGRAAGVTAGLVAVGLGAAVMKAANFDEAMSHVQSATQESAARLRDLREAALQAGQDTAFSATEAADGIEALAKAGVRTGDILGGGLSGALDLAAAGSIGVQEAAEDAASAMSQFGLKGKDVPHLADLLAAAAGKASGEVGDFSMALNQSGLVANQLGLSIDETVGALAAFAQAGLQGSDAGTSLKQLLLSLTPNSQQAAKMMDQLGFSAFDAKGNFVGLAEVAGRLQDSFGDLSKEDRTAAFKKIFGQDAIRAATVLFNQGADGVDKWTGKVDDAGYAAKVAAQNMDNLKGDLSNLGSAFETALIGTGEGGQGPLRTLTQDLTKAINAYNDLSPATKNATAGVLGFVGVAGGGVWVFSKVVDSVASMRATFDGLNTSLRNSDGSLNSATTKMIALRGAAAIGGTALFALGQQAGQSNKALGVLADSGGAAMLGFSLGGPWGAAIGAGAGALYGLATAGHKADDSLKSAKESAKAYAASLDQVTGAASTTTNTMVYLDLQRRGALTAASQLGISSRDLVAAAEGESGALGRVNKALREHSRDLTTVIDPLTGAVTTYGEYAGAVGKVSRALGFTTEKHREEAAAVREEAAATQPLAELFKNFPKKVITHMEQEGVPTTMAQVKALREQYDLTPRQVKTLAEVLGIDKAKGRISELQQYLNNLDGKSATTYVYTHYKAIRDSGGGQARAGFAGGGLIRGAGGPRDDQVPIWASNGEYVVNAAATARYRATLEAINADSQHYARYAGGGLVGSSDAGGIGGGDLLAEVRRTNQRLERLERAVNASATASGRAFGAELNGIAARADRRSAGGWDD